MEITIALALSILSNVISVSNFALNRKDKAVKDTKENHQELIEYQLRELKEDYKEISNDVKEIKKMLINYKDGVRAMIKESIEEHIKEYHKGE